MRDLPSKKRRSLAGSLLVAHPNMSDPNFRRTVLLISAHGPDEGALGVILNRPLDKHVSEIVTEPAPECLGEVPVFLGGPVGKNQLKRAWREMLGAAETRSAGLRARVADANLERQLRS